MLQSICYDFCSPWLLVCCCYSLKCPQGLLLVLHKPILSVRLGLNSSRNR